MLFVATIPMAKQIMLEMKARTNHSNTAKRKSVDTAIDLTTNRNLAQTAYKRVDYPMPEQS
jgi:hypothetical protein